MRWPSASRTLVAVALWFGAAACDMGDDRVARLELEVQELREAASATPADLGAAMAPLRTAIDTLAQRAEVDRMRWSSVTAELGQLALLMQGFVDESRRTQIDALRGRIGELERQVQEQAHVQGEERALLLRALEMTTTKLEASLRQVQADKRATGGEAPSQRRSWQDPVVWAPMAGGAVLLCGLCALGARRRARQRAVAFASSEPPEAVVDAPPPPASAPGSPRAAVPFGEHGAPHGPIALCFEVATREVDTVRERVAQWLLEDARVLRRPVPEFEIRGACLRVRCYVAGTMSVAERSSVLAEAQARASAESTAERRSA